MNSLDLLWELETHNLDLEQSRSVLKAIKESLNNIDLQTRLEDVEDRYNRLGTRLDNIKELIRKLEIELKNQEFLHREKKKSLYEGNIIDIKQLEQLDREEKEIKGHIDRMESEIIKNLEELDLIEEEMIEIKLNISSIKERLEDQIEEVQNNIVDLEKKIFKKVDYTSTISSKIDKKTLDLYEKLRKTKVNAIVGVNDDICSGCNMRIPNYQKNPLIKGEEIVICESCGRILYLDNK